MGGLLRKDLLNLKQQGKTYLCVVLVWFVISVMNQSPTFFGGVVTLFILMVPISAFAYDEKAKWDRYALTMPISKGDIVSSKYLLALICGVAGSILSMVVGIAISKDILGTALTSMILLSVGMILISLVLPFIFKFGVEKGRVMMTIVFVLPMLIIMLLSKLDIPTPNMELIEKAIYLLPLIAFVITICSISISKRVYRRKEF